MQRAMVHFFRDLFRMLCGKPFGCTHRWRKVTFGIRECEECKERQYLTMSKYPEARWN